MKTSFFGKGAKTLLFLLVSFQGISQQLPIVSQHAPPTTEPCGFDQIHATMMATDPVYMQRTIDFENAVQSLGGQNNSKVSPSQYTIPVVVHVMETGNSLTQITDAQIREGIKQLNERYRKVPGTPGDGNGVDVGLEFALAVRDPLGNCTDGIVRYDMTGNATYMASGVFSSSAGISDASLKATSVWDQTQYYNIWLVSEIDNNDGGAGIQGYAYFASAHGTSVDGAVILCSNFKDPASTTGTHELGHAFNLYHTFEGDGTGGTCPTNSNCNTQGDRVCDTPPHRRSSSDCVVGTNSCDGGSSTNLFIHNYMDYSSDACQSEFTAGQRTRVLAAMTTIRTSFLPSNGNMSLVPPTTAGVAFAANNSFVCSGNSIQLTDVSSCIPNTYLDTTNWSGITFNWTITNGVNTYTSTLQNPLLSIPVSGVYDVTLSITNSFGTTSHTETSFLVVGASPVSACSPGSQNSGFYGQTVNNVEFNTINNGTSQYTNVAYTDFSCAANTVVTEGTTHTMNINIRAGGSGNEIVQVYIDYNNNGTFEVGEQVLSGSTATNTSTVVTGSVTIPTTAVENTLLRMRVYGESGTLSNNERNCLASLFIGDVEDYGVYILPACTTPSISVTGSANPTTCVSSDGTITINGTGSGDVVWTGAMSGSANGVSLPYTITGLASGSYSITYGAGGCISTAVGATLTDPSAPAAPIVSASGSTTFCLGGSVTLTSSYATGNVWSTGATTQSIVVTTAGSYSVTYTNGSGCSSFSATTNVVVNALPAAPTITPAGPSVICPGGSLDLTSSQATNNLWSTGATSQTISVSAAGSYTVQYTDGNGCQSAASTPNVVTLATGGATLPISEGFVSATFPPTNWGINNGGNAVTWVRSNSVGNAPTAGNSARFDNYNVNAAGDSDDLVMQPADLSSMGTVQLTFDVAYARYDAVNFDQLDVLVTDDCGQTYTTVYSKSGSTLATDADNTNSYSPGTWRTETIDLSAFAGSSKVDILFRNISGWGNNLYLDNINLTGVVTCTQPTVPTVTASAPTVCDGDPVTLTITGNLNDATTWEVYSGSCGGTLVGSTAASTLVVTPSGPSTAYFVRGTGGCASPGSCGSTTVTVNPIQNAAFNYSAASYCNAASNPTPTITGTAGGSFSSTPAGLSINASTGTVNLTTSTAGTYTVTYTTPGPCPASSNVSIQVVATPAAPTVSVVDNCGSSTLTTSGTNLLWSTSETAPSISVVAAGTYTVTQTVSGCTSAPGTGLANPNPIPSISAGINGNPSTCGGTDGSISVSGSGTGVVSWTGPTSGSSGSVSLPFTITGLSAGSYTISFNNGCASNTPSVALTDPAAPAAPLVTVTNNCGSSVLTTAGTNLLWSTSETTTSITVGTAGTFTVTQTVAGCTSAPGTGIANPNAIPSISAAVNANPTVCGGTDGSISVSGSGTGAVSWTGISSGSSGVVTLPYTITGLAAGSYTVSFDDGCASNTPSVSLIDPGAPAAPVVTVTDNCGSSVLTTSGSNLVWSTTETTSSITVTSAGTYTVTQTVAGCTSAPGTGIANPLAGSSSNTTISSCDSYLWNGTTYTASGVYTWLGTNAVGCDSLATLNLTLNASSTSSSTVSACGSYLWNGTTYTTSGVYTWIGTNAVGCDSIATLNVTINAVATSNTPVSTCDPYTWNGTTYTSSGTYTWMGVGANGCDSIATLDLTVNSATSSNTTIAACDSYTWNGTTYTADGTYTWLGVNSAGCDSIATLDLTINASPTVALLPFSTLCDTDSDFTLSGGSPSGGIYSGPGVSAGVFSPSSAGVGSYTISYVFNDSNGCSNSVTGIITVDDCSGLNELSEGGISIFPNPAHSSVTITAENLQMTTIKVFDAAGRLVDELPVKEQSVVLNIQSFAIGVYQLQIETSFGIQYRRLVKQ